MPIFLTLVPLFACDQPPDEPHQPTPQPVQALALDCLGFRSTVIFAVLPDSPQVLQATYQGSDLAHWWLGAEADPGGGRRLRYRSGASVFAIEPSSATSLEYVGEEYAACMLQFELRRALMLWPDGFEWRGTQRGREFELPDGSGRLLVEFEGEQPIRFYSRNSEGVELESFSDLTWQEFKGRRFPDQATLSVMGGVVWTETLNEITSDCRYVSFFFLPPDRRPTGDMSTGQIGTLRHLDLPERLVRRLPLAAGLTWDEIQVRGAAARLETMDQVAGVGPDLAFAVELDQAAQPTALLLLLNFHQGLTQEHAEGALSTWSHHEPGPGLSVLLSHYKELTAGKLLGLQRFLPEGAKAGTSYLRLPAEGESGLPMQLVLTVKTD